MADYSKIDKYKHGTSDRNENEARLERGGASSNGDDLIDDEDAIERLLMDNAFDRPDHDKEEDDFAEIDELINEHFAGDQDSRVEEFAGDIERSMASMPIDNNGEGGRHELDELIEIDEFDDDYPGDTYRHDSTAESGLGFQEGNEESLMSDFDISASGKDDEIGASVGESGLPYGDARRDEEYIKEVQKNSEAVAAMTSQLSSLQDEQKKIWQHLDGMEAKDFGVRLVNEVDDVYDELHKMQRQMVAIDQKTPLLNYAALAVAVLALLIAVGLALAGMSAGSGSEELQVAISALEEKVDALATTSKGRDGNASVNNRLDRMDMELAAFSARISSLNNGLSSTEDEDERTKMIERIDQLEEQHKKTLASLEGLKRQVAQSERKKRASTKKTVPAASVTSNVNWKVNLVSFRQEWYAKRKSAEFTRQGVPAVVTRAVVDGETWYRLQVKGFENKAEATAYAGKVKKTLNLTSVWVTSD